jgi:hypothetical protein
MNKLTAKNTIFEYTAARVRAITDWIIKLFIFARLGSTADANIEPIWHTPVLCLIYIGASTQVGLECAFIGKSCTCLIGGFPVLIGSNGAIFIGWSSDFWKAGYLAH